VVLSSIVVDLFLAAPLLSFQPEGDWNERERFVVDACVSVTCSASPDRPELKLLCLENFQNNNNAFFCSAVMGGRQQAAA
jgi:hypothetical protein